MDKTMDSVCGTGALAGAVKESNAPRLAVAAERGAQEGNTHSYPGAYCPRGKGVLPVCLF